MTLTDISISTKLTIATTALVILAFSLVTGAVILGVNSLYVEQGARVAGSVAAGQREVAMALIVGIFLVSALFTGLATYISIVLLAKRFILNPAQRIRDGLKRIRGVLGHGAAPRLLRAARARCGRRGGQHRGGLQ
jgi:hypothetical protein